MRDAILSHIEAGEYIDFEIIFLPWLCHWLLQDQFFACLCSGYYIGLAGEFFYYFQAGKLRGISKLVRCAKLRETITAYYDRANNS